MEENQTQPIMTSEAASADFGMAPIALLPEHFSEIDINLIKPNPWQPRKVFREENLEELANSIKQHGILQPLVVIPAEGGTYQLVVGERRLRASKLAGLAKVPAIIRDAMT